MKDIIKSMLKVMTHKQKVNLWEQYNVATYSKPHFNVWIDYYLNCELYAKNYKLKLTKIK